MIQKLIKIHEQSVLVAIKMETRKRTKQTSKNNGSCRKWTPKWKPRRDHFLVIWLLFLCQTALGAQMAPKPPPRAPKTSPRYDFHRFLLLLNDFLMIFCIMCAIFYLVCLIIFLVTSSFHFQISGHKFKCVGVVRRGQ